MKRAWVAFDVLDQLVEESASKFPLETGGVLAGYCSTDNADVVITTVVGPGPKAIHKRCSYTPDYEFHREEIGRIYDESEGNIFYLGDWHIHPGGRAYLSWRDKRALRTIANFPDNYMDNPIMLVLGVEGDNVSVHVWRVSKTSNFRLLCSNWNYVSLDVDYF